MATDAQISANRANSQLSTGPKTEAGKDASSMNNFRHGFCGKFMVLAAEDQDAFDTFLESLRNEHQPSTPTEDVLVDKMAQHYWLSRRAQHLQDVLLGQDLPPEQFQKEFALFIRYQTTHDRAFYKSLTQLLKLRSEKRKAQKDEAADSMQATHADPRIGFDPQKRKSLPSATPDAEPNSGTALPNPQPSIGFVPQNSAQGSLNSGQEAR